MSTLDAFLDLPEDTKSIFDRRLSELFTECKPEPVHFYIPSKGRHDSCKTPATLDKMGISYSLVVEPQDEELYKSQNSNWIVEVLDKSNQGIYYVRNFIKDLSTSRNEPFHWAVDDDIKAFYDRSGPKRVKFTSPDPFIIAQVLMKEFPNLAQIGLVHDAFAFTRKRAYGLNKQVCSVMLNNNAFPYRFRDGIIEDTDYSLQALFDGNVTLELSRVSYLAPPQMKQKGGNTDDFLNNKLYQRQLKLAEEYAPWFTVKMEDSKSKIMPSRVWRQFNQLPKSSL